MDERKKRLTLKMVDSKRVLCEIFQRIGPSRTTDFDGQQLFKADGAPASSYRATTVEALVCRNQLVVSSCVCTSGTLLDVTRVGISRLKRTTISRYKHRCFQFIGRMSHEPRYEAKMRNYAYFVFYHIIRHCSNFTNRSKSSFERRYFRSERIFYLYNYYYIIIIIQFFYLYFAKI